MTHRNNVELCSYYSGWWDFASPVNKMKAFERGSVRRASLQSLKPDSGWILNVLIPLANLHLLSIKVSETQFCVCVVKRTKETSMGIMSYMRLAVAPSSSGGRLTPGIHRENTSHHLLPLIISYILIAYHYHRKILFIFVPISLCLISVYKEKK